MWLYTHTASDKQYTVTGNVRKVQDYFAEVGYCDINTWSSKEKNIQEV